MTNIFGDKDMKSNGFVRILVKETKFGLKSFDKSMSRLGFNNPFHTYLIDRVCDLVNNNSNHISSQQVSFKHML